MASTDKELEEELLQAGKKLVDPPSSVDDLLSLLCQVESCLSRVEQSPTESMQNALSPSLKVLIANKLVKHSDVDVKVAVASCFSEITRITAPDAPYDDDQMKEVFRLIVSSFENLHDSSNRWYQKRILILETVAKVRSCVVMLDLECDALILEMFQHFLKTIREHHPGNVFLSMETIMVLVLEESEDISLDLLSPILDSVKKDNEEVMPIARKLGERVLQSCAARLKPYLVQAVNTLGISLDDYSDVLASVCKDTSDNLALNDVHDCKSAEEPVEESAQVDSEITKEATPPQQDNAAEDRSPKSVMSNGIAQAGEDDALIDSKSLKKQDDTDSSVLSKGNNLSGNDLDIEKVDNKEQKLEQSTKKEQSTKRGGRKSSSSKSAKSSKNSSAVSEKEAEKTIDSKSHIKEVPSSLNEDGVVEATGTSENDREIKVKISSTKAGDIESDAVVSPSPSESNHDENRSTKRARTKKKDISVKEVAAEDDSKRVSEGTCDSEVKPTKPSAKKGLGRSSDMKITTFVDAVKKGSGKAEERTKGDGGSSSRKSEEKKRKGQEKGNLEKGLAKSSSKDEDKAVASSLKSARKTTKREHPEETPKTNLKRKRAPGKEKESDIKKNDESLVGTRVKVWWPDDEMFYEGVVDSFDSSIKKHKVLYDDGDEEILNFEEEKWEIIEFVADPDGEEGSHQASPDPSDDMPLKKKGKTNAGESKKEGKRDSSSKSGGATSSKSKGPSVKSNQKSKTAGKSEGEVSRKSKDAAQKTGGKSEDRLLKSGGKSEDRPLKSGGKSEDRPLKSGGKSEDRPLKSGGKSEDRLLKTGGKSEDRLLKTGSKSEDRLLKTGSKSEDRPLKSGGKSIDSAQKNNSKKTDASKIRKSKDDDVETPKQKPKQETPKTGKSKQGTSKIALSSKTKSTKSGKSNTNGTGKVKFILPKTEDSENSENENSDDSTNEVEDRKVKTSSSSKAGSEVKSGKKRGRN